MKLLKDLIQNLKPQKKTQPAKDRIATKKEVEEATKAVCKQYGPALKELAKY